MLLNRIINKLEMLYSQSITVFCLFTGRREFVQRLKLEGTLNVHDGCVSDSHLSVYQFTTNTSCCVSTVSFMSVTQRAAL